MQALVCKQWGSTQDLVFETLRSPKIKANEVLIKVGKVGLNLPDVLMISGHYQAKPPSFPFIPGGELIGEVLSLGSKVKDLQVGQRVLALSGSGALAQEAKVASKYCYPVPENLEASLALALGVAYTTAYLGLVRRSTLEPGQKVLVLGAGGNLGAAAVNLAAFLGAEVIACASSQEKLALASQQGAQHLIAYPEAKVYEQIMTLTKGQGLDLVYDPVGGDLFDQAIRALAWEGRVLSLGFASGRVPQISLNRLLLKNSSISGLFLGAYKHYQPLIIRKALAELMNWALQGKIKPFISKTYPFAEAKDALQSIAQNQSLGKVLVNLNDIN